jgi:hypothetical protein
MQLEGAWAGPPAIGVLRVEEVETLSAALRTSIMKRDHGEPQVSTAQVTSFFRAERQENSLSEQSQLRSIMANGSSLRIYIEQGHEYSVCFLTFFLQTADFDGKPVVVDLRR